MVCVSDECDRRLGGKGAKARAFGDRFIHVSPAGRDTVFLAHERTHIETHARIGSWALMRGRLPAWFDEGLAVIVSGDDRAKPDIGPDGPVCPLPQSPLPQGMRDWGREAGQHDRPIYRLAACQVLAWLDAHPGEDVIPKLLDNIRTGVPVSF